MKVSTQQVKQAARGRWPEILAALGGVDPALLDGKHHPCPKCGGQDRFRLIDADAGSLFCNQCFNKQNGDGLAALQWLRGWSFTEALQRVAHYLDLQGNGKATTSRRAAREDKPAGTDWLAKARRFFGLPAGLGRPAVDLARA